SFAHPKLFAALWLVGHQAVWKIHDQLVVPVGSDDNGRAPRATGIATAATAATAGAARAASRGPAASAELWPWERGIQPGAQFGFVEGSALIAVPLRKPFAKCQLQLLPRQRAIFVGIRGRKD